MGRILSMPIKKLSTLKIGEDKEEKKHKGKSKVTSWAKAKEAKCVH